MTKIAFTLQAEARERLGLDDEDLQLKEFRSLALERTLIRIDALCLAGIPQFRRLGARSQEGGVGMRIEVNERESPDQGTAGASGSSFRGGLLRQRPLHSSSVRIAVSLGHGLHPLVLG